MGFAFGLIFALTMLVGSTDAHAFEAALAIGTFFGASGWVAVIVGGLVIGAGAYAAAKLFMPEFGGFDASSASRGSLVNKEGTSNSIPVVYGQRRVGGTRIFLDTNGTDNINLHMVLSMCEGPINGFTHVWFNDELVATSSDLGATWSYEGGYDGKLTIYAYDGTQTTACPLVGETFSSGVDWTANHIGHGIAYMYLIFQYDQDLYTNGLPTVTATIQGKLVPSNVGDAYNQNLVYDNNPARVIYDYMVNPDYGKAIDPSLIDSASFTSAFNYCNETVQGEKRYTLNGYIDTNQRMYDALQEMLGGCRGFVTTTDKYQLHINRPVDTSNAPVINDDNIIGDIEFAAGSKKTLLNYARAKFNNENAEFNYMEDFKIVESTTLQSPSYDGARLSAELVYPHTTSATTLNRILTEEINQSRQSGQLMVTTTTAMFEYIVGDVIKFTNDTLGQTDKLYRIVGFVLTTDQKMELTLVEYDPNVFWDNNQSIIINNKDDTDH